MLKHLLSLAALFIVGAATAQSPLWLRGSAISPDGKTIAFTYKGNIFTVPVTGGKAKAITTNAAHDTRPVWSPDSKKIAFASNRDGSFNVFLTSAEGGVAKKITTNSSNEYPVTFADANTILFTAGTVADAKSDMFPSGTFFQVWSVDTKGSRPQLYNSLPLDNIAVKNGKVLYNDVKGYEDPWRKHHTSSITRDVWLLENGKYKKLTDFKGEDRNPVWASDGTTYYYLSEQDGTFNVYKNSINGGKAQQVTAHKKHPVRYLSIADDGTMAYSYDGELYTVKDGGKPQKIAVEIVADEFEPEVRTQFLSGGVGQMAVSPSGKEIAFIVRGDVYVTSTDYNTTKRITNTPEQERDVDFSPDGRSILYSSERNGIWNIYQSSIVREGEKQFTYATDIVEKPVTNAKVASFQGRYSPDGKQIAYLEDRTTLKVADLATGKSRTILDGKFNYSYSDGDQYFTWSPDGKYILSKYIGIGGWNNPDMALIEVANGNVTNLTESGYSDGGGKWVLDGRAMLWGSDRAGMRSHGSWGATADAYLMFFDDEAYDRFRMTKEEAEVNPKDTTKKELKLDLDNRRNRIIRVTGNSSSLADFVLSKDGNKLYYLTSFEGQPDLWERDFKENTTKILVKGAGWGSLTPDKEGKNIYMASGGGLKKIEVASGKVTPIAFNAQFDHKAAAERQYIFEHAWQQVADKFYVVDIHGVDWKGYREAYSRFLPYINNNFDFAEMLGEMLGELNGSHTGARYRPFGGAALAVASLGAFFDNGHKGDGLLIEEIIAGSPLQKYGSKVQKGEIITKIDGTQISAGADYNSLLAGKAGKQIELTIYNPTTKHTYNQPIKAISQGENGELLYRRWVQQRRDMVSQISGGKVGYVHVRGMNSESFREVYAELLGRYRQCDAVVIDTRHNGGGWLHDDLATLLSGKEYQKFTPRGNYIGSDPYNKWTKPSIVLQCEDNYSNAHGFPWLYKELGIGKLVGAPVPGTMTAVWWETQIDPSLVFGIPQVAVQDMRGKYHENTELQPDIEVYNRPEEVLAGKDYQLEVAVKELMKK
ncbi:putative Tricorn-like protease [Mucinivorans hirudinis]|uniref:Tricorn protease homolog n=1 Tax=Mucinivorans hirudinis TaxID=1433126 RepID=A0A060R7P4_9BACT|nr:putative Tricorn-like protease [Mucinivorans hirudinis]